MPNTAKQEAIRKAYGEYWDNMSPELQEIALRSDGWIQMRDFIKELGEDFSLSQHLSTEPNFNSSKQRPKSLQGIENNNGWTRVESEDDYPSPGQYWVIYDDGDMFITDMEFFEDMFDWSVIRYYHPIVKPEKPIY